MPYSQNSDLPAAVRNHLPLHAQDIYREAFNRAFAAHTDDPRQEEAAHRIAWAAVKRRYMKEGDTWVAWRYFSSIPVDRTGPAKTMEPGQYRRVSFTRRKMNSRAHAVNSKKRPDSTSAALVMSMIWEHSGYAAASICTSGRSRATAIRRIWRAINSQWSGRRNLVALARSPRSIAAIGSIESRRSSRSSGGNAPYSRASTPPSGDRRHTGPRRYADGGAPDRCGGALRVATGRQRTQTEASARNS